MQVDSNLAALYLIPSPLLGQSLDQALPIDVRELISGLKYFIVENAKTSRAFLKQVGTKVPLQNLRLEEFNEHSADSIALDLLSPIQQGISAGLISEAGVPCLADPGAIIVAKAHKLGIQVKPLVGPSSILLAIIASGLNGQNFAFNGYLPAKSPDREHKIKELESTSRLKNQAQFFIETPYRAQKLFNSIIETVKTNVRISLAINVASPEQAFYLKTAADWKQAKIDVDGKLIVFGIQA